MLAALLVFSLNQSPSTADAPAGPAQNPAPAPALPASPADEGQSERAAAPAPPSAPGPGATPDEAPAADATVEGVDGALLKGAQLAACGGVSLVAAATTTALWYGATSQPSSATSSVAYPVAGGVACLLLPTLYGTAVTATGNFVAPRQAPLVWPIATLYGGTLATAVLGAATGAAVAAALYEPPRDSNWRTPEDMTWLNVALGSSAAVGVAGLAVTGVLSTFVWDANAVPKTEPRQFQLAVFDMDEPFLDATPRRTPAYSRRGGERSMRAAPVSAAGSAIPMRF